MSNAYEQKRNEKAAFVAIKAELKRLGVPCSDLRISDGMCTYAADYGICGEELTHLNRRFLLYLTERPEEAIRRYITESVTLTEEAPAMKDFSEDAALASICRLLHERGIERDHDEIREAAKRQLRMRPSLKHLQGTYESLEQALTENPTHEFPRLFKTLKIDRGWSRLAFATYIEEQLTR